MKRILLITLIALSQFGNAQDCTVNTNYEQHSCSSYTFFEENQIELQWTVNDEFYQSGWGIDFDPTEAGTYEICGYYETVDCPEGPFACETIVVSPDCFGDCTVGITINEIDCDTYVVSESSGQQVSWFINDEFVSFFHAIDFDPTEAGTYEICAGIETPECPQGVFACETIVVSPDCFENDCEFNVQINQQSCAAYELSSSEEIFLDWYINDEFQLTGIAFDFYPDTPGTYEICVVNEGCPPATNFCKTFVITEDCLENECEFNVQINQQSCSGYNLFSVEQEYLDWYINDEFQTTSITFDFYPDTSGTYEICAVNEGCPPATNFCETFVITEDCLESECPISISFEEHACNTFTFTEDNGIHVAWTVNGEFYNYFHGIDFDPVEPGNYEICATYETEDCPLGVTACETLVISEDCFESECPISISYEEHACNTFTFTEDNGTHVAWTINGEFYHYFHGIDFDPTEPGTYKICATYEADDGSCSESTCETLVISEDCFETVNVVETLQDQEIIIRPTITKSDFHIYGLSGNCSIEIINQNGALVFQTIVNGDMGANCDISNLLPGLYYVLILNSENKYMGIRRILKM